MEGENPCLLPNLVSNLVPHLLQVLLDGPGILKYSDFGLSKVEGENLEDLFQKFADAGETFEATLDEYKKTRTSGISGFAQA